jgi:hypothetical protein
MVYFKILPLYIIAMCVSDFEVRSRVRPLDALRKLDYLPRKIKSICMLSLVIGLGTFDVKNAQSSILRHVISDD